MGTTLIDTRLPGYRWRWPILVTLLSIYWAIGFYPYEWVTSATYSQNGAKLVSGTLSFNTPGIAVGDSPSNWVDKVKNGKRFDLELTVKPLESTVTKVRTIFTMSASLTERNVAVEQDESGFLVWVRTPGGSSKGYPYFFNKIFEDKGWHNIRVTLFPGLLEIYIDGSRRLSLKRGSLNASNWSSFHHVAFGNEQSGDMAWLGAIKKAQVTVGDDSRNYLAGNAITIPEQLEVKVGSVRADWIPFSGAVTAPTLLDWAVNLVGFIPLGVASLLFFRRNIVMVAAVLSAVVSISIELGQLYIAVRTSQIDDILFNVGGGIAGGLIGLWVSDYMKRLD